jgi:hypothetical protein
MSQDDTVSEWARDVAAIRTRLSEAEAAFEALIASGSLIEGSSAVREAAQIVKQILQHTEDLKEKLIARS